MSRRKRRTGSASLGRRAVIQDPDIPALVCVPVDPYGGPEPDRYVSLNGDVNE
jgi:hypothetical protein